MTLQELRYLVAIADTKHFERAAEICHISQSTLSLQLKKLEEHLNVPLLDRSQRQVTPTPTGEEIIAQARLVLETADKIYELASKHRDPMVGALRLGIIPTLGPYLMPHLIPIIHATFPQLRLFVREDLTGHLLEHLRSGKLDVLLLALPIHDEHLEVRPLFEEPFEVALPVKHPLTVRAQIREADLSNHSVLLLEEGHCLREQALAICGSPKRVDEFAATSLETLCHMVAMGTGVTLLPALAGSFCAEPIRQTLLQIRPFMPPVPKRKIGLAWRCRYAREETLKRLAELIDEHLPVGVFPLKKASATSAPSSSQRASSKASWRALNSWASSLQTEWLTQFGQSVPWVSTVEGVF
jgi:LysR family hydrogen peroxide-inducible transcriptional activator